MSSACAALSLGDVDSVPVKKGGPRSQGRGQLHEILEYGSEYEIDVSFRFASLTKSIGRRRLVDRREAVRCCGYLFVQGIPV